MLSGELRCDEDRLCNWLIKTAVGCGRGVQIEESSDDGDEYDYSPKEEWVITAANAKPQCDIIHEAWQDQAVIRYDMAVPLNLSERSARQSWRVGVVLVVTTVVNSRRIDVDINLDNQADDHRLRVLVPALSLPTVYGRYAVSLADAPRERQCNEQLAAEAERRRFRYRYAGLCCCRKGVTAWLY